jgi:uncharacterized membrane protein
MDLFSVVVAAVPSFIASGVEVVEATTIVLAVGMMRGWRAPLAGAVAALVTLGAIIAIVGVALVRVVPEHLLQAVVGTLLLLFGLRWLRKAVLRFAGIVALHDEELAFQRERAELRARGLTRSEWDWVGTLVAYKAVLLEGTEVAFIVITLGASSSVAMGHAIVGAVAAAVIVVALAALLRHPLTAVPENWMKFVVGAMLSTFGVFWFGEGVGGSWPGDAASLFPILLAFFAVSWIATRTLRTMLPEGARVEARNI